ncbi:DUF6188 family protein [Kitasatospora sp. NPDC054939]
MQRSITDVLAGHRVVAVGGGVHLDITLATPGGPVTVRVGHEFRFAAPSEVEHFYPALSFAPTAPLLDLVGRTVETARVTMAGGLELAFTGGGRLSVPPHAQLGPWSVLTPRGTLCTALPGGDTAWEDGGPG